MQTLYKKIFAFKGSEADALHRCGGNADFERKAQPEFMRSVGLLPKHRFLDLGCGCLRGTIDLIDYLNPGNFYGLDVSEGMIEKALDRSKECANTPNLMTMDDFDLTKKIKGKIDFILSVSLLTHLLPDDLPELFAGVRDILSEDGKWLFTIYPVDEKPFQGNTGVMFYRKEYLIEKGERAGLLIEDIPGDHPNPCGGRRFIERVNFPMIGQWVMKAGKFPKGFENGR